MICTLTINPAIDRILYLKEFSPNNTNRVKKKLDVLGGKGTHVSLNLSILRCPNKAFGLDFGQTGHIIEKMLENDYTAMRFQHYEGFESRTNYAIIEENTSCTLVTEKGNTVPKDICQALIQQLYDEVNPGDIFILSGDASNTEVPYMYCEIMKTLADKNVKFFLDTSSDNLIEGIKEQPFLIKPNEDELSQLLGRTIDSEASIIDGLQELSKKEIPCIALTCGGNGSYIWYEHAIYRIYPMQLNVVNTIGCGDAFLSGMAYGFDHNMDFIKTLTYASAVSSATAESNSTVGFDFDRAMELMDNVKIEKIL